MSKIITVGTPFTFVLPPPCIAAGSGTILASYYKIKVLGKNAALESDIKKSLEIYFSRIPYTTPPFVGGFLKFKSIKRINLSHKTKSNGYPVVLEGSITVKFIKAPPGQCPSPSGPVLDETPFYLCTFQLNPSQIKASSK